MSLDIHPGDQAATTSTAAAVTNQHQGGIITTESLTTAAGVTYSMVVTSTKITLNSLVFASVSTTGTGDPIITSITTAAGSATIRVKNDHASAAFNAVLLISYLVF